MRIASVFLTPCNDSNLTCIWFSHKGLQAVRSGCSPMWYARLCSQQFLLQIYRAWDSKHTGDVLVITQGQNSWAMISIQLLSLYSLLTVVYLVCKEQPTWTRWAQVFGDTMEVNSSLRAIGITLNSLSWRLALAVAEPGLKRTDSCRTLGPWTRITLSEAY